MTCRALLHSVRLPKQSSFTTQGSSRGLLTSVEGFGGLPYTLHAQCSDNNTILTLSLDSPRNGLWGSEHADRQKLGGKVVARITSGQVGFKKGQRGTFEAGAGTSSAMMKLIDTIQYPSRDLEASSRRNRNSKPKISDLTIAFKGFGQGREALFSALTAAEGRTARMLLKRLQDVTPLKIGGGRARKRRVL